MRGLRQQGDSTVAGAPESHRATLRPSRRREFGALEELLCDDAVFDVAYAPAGAAFTVKGATAIQAMFETGVATVFSRLDFEVLATYLGQDPGVIVVEYASSGVAAPTGRPYWNRYAGIFTVRDGKVAL